jgi:hypothetical protein
VATAATAAAVVTAKTYTDGAIVAAATPIAGLSPSSTIAADDMVAISVGGVDRRIRYADFVDGETVDQLAAAVTAADSDVLIVGQGSSTVAAQTFSALWTWISTHLRGWKRPVVEVSTNTQLDGSIHNRAILVCSVAVTISPAFLNRGLGVRLHYRQCVGGERDPGGRVHDILWPAGDSLWPVWRGGGGVLHGWEPEFRDDQSGERDPGSSRSGDRAGVWGDYRQHGGVVVDASG